MDREVAEPAAFVLGFGGQDLVSAQDATSQERSPDPLQRRRVGVDLGCGDVAGADEGPGAGAGSLVGVAAHHDADRAAVAPEGRALGVDVEASLRQAGGSGEAVFVDVAERGCARQVAQRRDRLRFDEPARRLRHVDVEDAEGGGGGRDLGQADPAAGRRAALDRGKGGGAPVVGPRHPAAGQGGVADLIDEPRRAPRLRARRAADQPDREHPKDQRRQRRSSPARASDLSSRCHIRLPGSLCSYPP